MTPGGQVEWDTDYELELSDGSTKLVDVIVTATISNFYPAKTYGPPEHCYPSEGGTAEITVTNSESGDDITAMIDPAQITKWEEQAIERHEDKYYDPCDPWPLD